MSIQDRFDWSPNNATLVPATNSTRLVAWNVNHRAARHAIPQWISEEIKAASADILILLEYVRGSDHDRFIQQLASCGLTNVSLSKEGFGNQLLIATREKHDLGPTLMPEIPWVPGNVLHIVLDGGTNIIGFRMPAFEKEERQFKRPTWDWLREQARAIVDRPAMIAGDFNTASGDSAEFCGDCIEMFRNDGWAYTIPASGHSWCWKPGATERRIDYAFISPSLSPLSAEYSWSFRENHGITSQAPGTPDHAMLRVEFTAAAARLGII